MVRKAEAHGEGYPASERIMSEQTLWCCKFRYGWRTDGEWWFCHVTIKRTRRESILGSWVGKGNHWAQLRRKGVAACVKVRIIEAAGARFEEAP